MSVKDGLQTTVGGGCGCAIVILGMAMVGGVLLVILGVLAAAAQM